MNVEEILNKLVNFNTIKDKDNLLIMNFCKSYLENLGFECILYGTDKKILYGKYGKKPILGFVGHTDTVNHSNEWNTNPFTLVEKDDKLFGLGTCDMKGGIAAFLKAISSINLKKLKRGITVILTYDEEINFEGILSVINNNIELPEYLIIGEPTDNIPNNGSKGLLEYSLEFYGVRTHSSMPIESPNKNCISFFNEILKLDDYFKERCCNDYEFPNSTMNIGIINGGDSVNIVPDITRATLVLEQLLQGKNLNML